MFTSFSDQIAAGVRPLFISQLTLWSAINQRALDGVVALAALNMNTVRQSVVDVSDAFSPAMAGMPGQALPWTMVGHIPRDPSSFTLYGKEISNIYTEMHSDIARLMQEGFNEISRDMPSIFKNPDIGSPAPRVSQRKKT